jgi:hypothetical protein
MIDFECFTYWPTSPVSRLRQVCRLNGRVRGNLTSSLALAELNLAKTVSFKVSSKSNMATKVHLSQNAQIRPANLFLSHRAIVTSGAAAGDVLKNSGQLCKPSAARSPCRRQKRSRLASVSIQRCGKNLVLLFTKQYVCSYFSKSIQLLIRPFFDPGNSGRTISPGQTLNYLDHFVSEKRRQTSTNPCCHSRYQQPYGFALPKTKGFSSNS